MADSSSHTLVCSVIFLDIRDYSKLTVSEQLSAKREFNAILGKALEPVETQDRILLDTGDGAAVTFLGPPEDALFVGLDIREHSQAMPIRMGINLGPVRLLNDLNGRINIVGDGINVAQRIMDFSEQGQLLVSRSFFEVVSRLAREYGALFKPEGAREDKHKRSHEFYSVADEAHSGLRNSDTEIRLRTRRDFMAKVVDEFAAQSGLEMEKPDPVQERQPASVFDAGTNLIISGHTERSVREALDRLMAEGATTVSPIARVNNKWLASCEHPKARVMACTVVDLGSSRIITGPTPEAVAAKLEELAELGYRPVRDIETAGGVWTAVCERNY
ncbi:MAG: adenylate/guanylate cyclase domain-containing protein [Betaproteobacteria bacterium]